MTTQLKDLMSLADNYAQACVDLECENQERRGIVDGSSVAAVDESRQRLENELRRLYQITERDEALLRQALDTLEEINKLSLGVKAESLPGEIDSTLDDLRERLGEKT